MTELYFSPEDTALLLAAAGLHLYLQSELSQTPAFPPLMGRLLQPGTFLLTPEEGQVVLELAGGLVNALDRGMILRHPSGAMAQGPMGVEQAELLLGRLTQAVCVSGEQLAAFDTRFRSFGENLLEQMLDDTSDTVLQFTDDELQALTQACEVLLPLIAQDQQANDPARRGLELALAFATQSPDQAPMLLRPEDEQSLLAGILTACSVFLNPPQLPGEGSETFDALSPAPDLLRQILHKVESFQKQWPQNGAGHV